MLDGFHILTLTHRDAPLQLLAHAVLPEPFIAERLSELKSSFGWEELCYIATCNRVAFAFYDPCPQPENLAGKVLEKVRPDLPEDLRVELAEKFRLLNAQDAVSHILELAASVDSLVVGEREILRQLREAYEQSRVWGLTGDHLRLLMRYTVETAKEIYTDTEIGSGALSVVALAFNEMMHAGARPQSRVLLVGAGQTNTLYGKFLLKNGFKNVTVFNRSLHRAESLAKMGAWNALTINELPFFSEGFDVMVVCTAATEPIIQPALYKTLLAGENTPKIVVDLSVPNNVAASVREQFPVQFIEVESLRGIADQNLQARERAREDARRLIARRVLVFCERWHERQVERLLSDIPDEVNAVKMRAIEEVYAKRIALLDPSAKALLEEMLGYMEKKCVAIPMKAAKRIVLGARQAASRKNTRSEHPAEHPNKS